jgi:hypothetical protein
VQIFERSLGLFGLFAAGIELEISLVFGDGFVLFLHLLGDLGEGKVTGGVVGLYLNGIFGAEISALKVFVVQVELRNLEVFVDAFVVRLNVLDFGKRVAMDGGAFGARRGCGSIRGGIVCTGAAAAATAIGIVAGQLRRKLGGEGMVGCSG